MLKIGITGGIGSGKSTVCKVFEQLNIPVFNADWEAKNLLSSTKVKEFYRIEFGSRVFSGTEIDKVKLSQLIFSDHEALNKVNGFIHPLVFQAFEKWCAVNGNAPYVIKEAALLFESKANNNLDYTILITAPTEKRIERVMHRDHVTRENVIMRINNQMQDSEKVNLANFVIDNDGNALIIPQILAIHNKLINRKEL
jgi:dephospho-CoA kinase